MNTPTNGKSTARDMTQGPILKQLVLFALPLMLGNIFQMLYNTVDSVIVGNFVSKQALAAIGSTTVIVNMLVFFFNGFSIGAAVVIGRYFGARNMEKLHAAVETTMAATFVLSAFFTLLGVALVKPMLIIITLTAFSKSPILFLLSIHGCGTCNTVHHKPLASSSEIRISPLPVRTTFIHRMPV